MSRQILTDVVISLSENAERAAAYLDACEGGQAGDGLDPGYYQASAGLLTTLFAMVDPALAFPGLLARSPAAREIRDAIALTGRLQTARRIYCPQLEALLRRIGA